MINRSTAQFIGIILRIFRQRNEKLIGSKRKINNDDDKHNNQTKKLGPISFAVEGDTAKMGGNISRYISLARPIGKISPFVSIVTENQCAFFTSRRTMGKGNAEASASRSLSPPPSPPSRPL